MVTRAIFVSIVGVLAGAAVGAVTFGWDAWLDVGSSFIGLTSNWWPLHAMVGGLGGAVFGLLLGLFTLTRVHRVFCFLVGCLIGLLGAVVLLFMNADRLGWQQRSVPAQIAPLLLSGGSWAVIGWLIGLTKSKSTKSDYQGPQPSLRILG